MSRPNVCRERAREYASPIPTGGGDPFGAPVRIGEAIEAALLHLEKERERQRSPIEFIEMSTR